MPYRNMSLAELAKHIGMNVRDVKRLTERGTLPGRLIGGEWRFNSAQMLDWLQQEMHTLDRRDIDNLDRAMSAGGEERIISNLLPTEALELNLRAKSRASVIRELVSLAERTGLVWDRVEIIDSLEKREAIASTAQVGGVAFPHPVRPLPYATAEPLVCLARIPGGIPFGAPDGRLTDLFAMVCCHDERQHLLALARLALLLTSGLAESLREVTGNEEALALVLETERELLRKRA